MRIFTLGFRYTGRMHHVRGLCGRRPGISRARSQSKVLSIAVRGAHMKKSDVSLLDRVRMLPVLPLFLLFAGCQLRAQSSAGRLSTSTQQPGSQSAGPRAVQVAAEGGHGFGGGPGKFNPFAPKEPMVADPNKAYPRVQSPPGAPFRPVSYSADSLIAQLAHSSDGIVRLPPGDYSIPVRFY